jgi:protein-disulfide isomerase
MAQAWGEATHGRLGRCLLLAVVLAGGFAGGTPAEGGERELTRFDLVAMLEKGPGPAKGEERAPVVLVELSDFQCFYCGKFAQETLPRIDEAYIRPGKLRFVYRHMAIFGEASLLASQASACAFDQQKFWPYHDTLFEKRSPLAFTAAKLKEYAGRLGLNGKGFAACLDSKKFAEIVETETLLGRALGASGTPAFLLNGELMIGAQPFESFRARIDAILNPRSPRR